MAWQYANDGSGRDATGSGAEEILLTGKRRIIFATIVIVLFGAVYMGSAFVAAYRLMAAARSGDVDALDDSVDFPAIRDNFKAELTARMASKVMNDPETRDNPFASLGAMIVPAMIDKMVNDYVTPAGLSLIIEKGKRPDDTKIIGAAHDTTIHYDFISLDRFRAKISKIESQVDFIRLVFERRGLLSWKLIRITFPAASPIKATTLASEPAEPSAALPEATTQPPDSSPTVNIQPLGADEAAFADYPSTGLVGSFAMPNFAGDPKHVIFRTRLIDSANGGANFAGHFALTQIGCGAQCNFAALIDGNTGKVLDFPIGGEEYLQMSLSYRSDSNLVKAYWNPDEVDQPTCEHTNFVLEETGFRRLPTDGKRVRCPV